MVYQGWPKKVGRWQRSTTFGGSNHTFYYLDIHSKYTPPTVGIAYDSSSKEWKVSYWALDDSNGEWLGTFDSKRDAMNFAKKYMMKGQKKTKLSEREEFKRDFPELERQMRFG
jgi:hypothetical protein